uniref:peptidase U32 family protein n=1 Tax=Butyribacter sp. TaxID=2822465 RepID=UPI0040289E65
MENWMMQNRTKRRIGVPEILAPAGSMESLKAAVAAGCDAVYMGGSKFGARAYAQNPEEDEMVAAIRYCHLYGVKLYMTVNTLLKEQELQSLPTFLRPYYEAGLDAVIVQDMGVLRVIHQCFPDLDIHASTQMTLTSGMGVDDRLAAYGVTR